MKCVADPTQPAWRLAKKFCDPGIEPGGPPPLSRPSGVSSIQDGSFKQSEGIRAAPREYASRLGGAHACAAERSPGDADVLGFRAALRWPQPDLPAYHRAPPARRTSDYPAHHQWRCGLRIPQPRTSETLL